MLGKWRHVALAVEVAQHLALVFLEQAVGVVLRVPLEEDDAKPILAGGRCTPASALSTRIVQPGVLELLPRDLVEARVRHVEARVDVAHQRVRRRDHAVAVHAPALAPQLPAFVP